MSDQTAKESMRRMEANRAELVRRLLKAMTADGPVEPQPGLYLYRSSAPTEPVQFVHKPALCVIAQGAKEVMLGAERYRYGPAHYLLAAVQLPVAAQVVEAAPERPYLSLSLDLDPVLLTSVLVEIGRPRPPAAPNPHAMAVSPLDEGLLDAVVRLVRLLDVPAEFKILSPLVMREIIYRLLMGEQGDRLRYIADLGGHPRRITRALELLHRSFDQPLRIGHLARELGMSASSFHHHFKAVTAMSPLQYQKKLRLHEARRLMLGEELDATQACLRVGYADASHFSRDYKRLFGEPPRRDVKQLLRTASS